MTVLPNFLVVGAARSGTTSLYECLRHHPQIFMPAEAKEPSYFVPQAGGVAGWEEYVDLFESAADYPRRGEASVSYLMAPDAPKKICEVLGPDIRIVVMLRDPVAMAYSNWGHQIRRGCESASFTEAVKDEHRRLTDPEFAKSCRCWVSDVTYIARARYGEQVARYLDVFGSENVACYLFEEFFQEGLPLLPSLCRFLGVTDDYKPANRVHNQAGVVRSTYVRSVLTERMRWKEPLKKVLPIGMRRLATGALARFNNVEREPDPIPYEAAAIVRQSLAEDVQVLSGLIGRADLETVWSLMQPGDTHAA